MFSPKQTTHEVHVHICWSGHLKDVGLINNIGIVVGMRCAVSDIESAADAFMRVPVMAPKQQVVPVAAETQQAHALSIKHHQSLLRAPDIQVGYVERSKIERIIEVVNCRKLQAAI